MRRDVNEIHTDGSEREFRKKLKREQATELQWRTSSKTAHNLQAVMTRAPRWSEADVERLRTMATKATVDELTHILSRSRGAITAKVALVLRYHSKAAGSTENDIRPTRSK
jgi:hypothetical protein